MPSTTPDPLHEIQYSWNRGRQRKLLTSVTEIEQIEENIPSNSHQTLIICPVPLQVLHVDVNSGMITFSKVDNNRNITYMNNQ